MSNSLPTKSLLGRSIHQQSKLFYGVGLTALLTVSSQQALAGGFQLSDHSITSLGRNHAGYGVVGDDASAVQFNPAGLTLLKQRQAQFGLTFNTIDAEVRDRSEDGGSTGVAQIGVGGNSNDDGTPDFASAPNAYYIHPINDRLVFGIGLTAPFGTDTDYDGDFFGRFNGTETELTVIDINPSIGYKINDFISIGAGISYQKLDVTLDSALSFGPAEGEFLADGDSEDFGFNIGVTFDLPDNSRIGLSYRSEVEHDIDVDTTIISPFGTTESGADADFIAPATAYLGYYKPVSKNYFLTVGVRWTEWSSFEEIRIQFDNGTADAVTEIDWEDNFTYAIGLDGRINDKWTWRTGLSYTETPVPTETRSVRTIDSDRRAISFGATYKFSPKLTLDFAYRYINFEGGDIDQTVVSPVAGPVGSIVADVEPEVHTVAIQANYKF